MLTVLWNEKYRGLMANYISILVWRRLPSELTSPVKWSPRAEGASLCSISQGLHLAHKKPEYEYGFIQYLVIKNSHKNHPYILSIDALLSPSLRNVWGFLSGPRVVLHSSNERLEYYAARGKPLWRHNGFYDAINAKSRQKIEHNLSYRCANNAIELCQSDYRK